MDFPFGTERQDFPVLETQVQLTSCSQSALSRQVHDAIGAFLDTWRQRGWDWPRWLDELNAAKARFARLINASPDDIAVLSSVSHAAATVGSALRFDGQRNEVVITEMDFPTLGHLWLRNRERGAKVQIASWDGEHIDADTLRDYVGSSTALVSVPHQAYYNGARADLASIGELARDAGALVFVDAYQSLGTTQIDVQQLPIDAMATGLQKYLLGTPGIAFLYVRPEVSDQLLPTVTGWFGQANPFAFEMLPDEPAPGARRFEGGTPAALNGYAARAALDVLLDAGIDRIESYLRDLTEWTVEQAGREGLELASPTDRSRMGPNIAVRVSDAHAVQEELRERGVLVSARSDVIRVAPHFYNHTDDLAFALQSIREVATVR